MKNIKFNKSFWAGAVFVALLVVLAGFKNSDKIWIVGDKSALTSKKIHIGGGTIEWDSGAGEMQFSNDGGITPVEIGTSTEIPTGALFDFTGSTPPTGYVLASGATIGAGASGATERANADTVTLFTLLWNDFANAQLAIQDSAGVPTTRGASAAADFSANKRLTVPDLRGRVTAGDDDMGPLGAANRITTAGSGLNGSIIGGGGGSEDHTLTPTQGPITSHTHTLTGTAGNGGAHSHLIGSNTAPPSGAFHPQAVDGGGPLYPGNGSTNGAPNHTHAVTGSANAPATANAANAHPTLGPTFILRKIIKL